MELFLLSVTLSCANGQEILAGIARDPFLPEEIKSEVYQEVRAAMPEFCAAPSEYQPGEGS